MTRKSFQIKKIDQIPFEGVHEQPNSRKTLVSKEDLISDNIDALTKGFLQPGQKWDWHSHKEHDEIGIVLRGTGQFFWEDQVSSYQSDDVIIIPANSKHKFEADGEDASEFYFVRIKI